MRSSWLMLWLLVMNDVRVPALFRWMGLLVSSLEKFSTTIRTGKITGRKNVCCIYSFYEMRYMTGNKIPRCLFLM